MDKIGKMDKKRLKINCFGLSDQIFFAQRLSLLLNSGISTVEALGMMKNIESSIHRKNIYGVLVRDLERGISLHKSVKNIGLKFNNVLTTLLKNGEENGRLAETLHQAYIYLEKSNEIKGKIISSLVYPAFIVLSTVLMTLFLILYIFPKIIPLLNSLNIKLPLITRIVQGLYLFMIGYGIYFVLLIFILFVLLFFFYKKNHRFKYRLHRLSLSIPIFSKYLKIYSVSTLCSVGEILISSGKSIPEVLTFWGESSTNILYKESFIEIQSDCSRGIPLATSLKRFDGLFPGLLIDMVTLGEKTGNIGLMFIHCSNIFKQDIENVVKRFTSLIEPLLMVFMGLVVGSVALSIILPVYEITNHLSK